jgi:hypothetical protein
MTSQVRHFNVVRKKQDIEKRSRDIVIEEEKTVEWPKDKGQKDKINYTKHYTETTRLSNANPTRNRGWMEVHRKGR